MENQNLEGQVLRKEIGKGIFMEKFQEKINDEHFYVISLELLEFKMLHFTVDFTGSENIEFIKGLSYIQSTQLQPFSKKEVARLLLQPGWNLKTKIKFNITLPDIDRQTEYLKKFEQHIKQKVHETFYLKKQSLETMTFIEIQSILKEKGDKFIDTEFPPNEFSIEDSKEDIIEKYEKLIQWRTLEDIYDLKNSNNQQPILYDKNIDAGDLDMGELKDQWVISSISAIAEYPEYLQQILLIDSYNQIGFYKIKLFIENRWQQIILDDYFPCIPGSDFIFGQNETNQFWCQLLEKGFAKLYKQYKNLERGNPLQSLFTLTGCPTFQLELPSDIEDQNEIDLTWQKMKQWKDKNYIVTSSTKHVNDSEIERLIKEQTYSILRVEEVEGHKLLQLRNPWGVFEWNGDWSQNSSTWSTAIKEKLNIKQFQEGCFWISYKHFLENFGGLNTCYINKWYQLFVKGKFIKGEDSFHQTPHMSSRWNYIIKISKPTNLIIGIHQEDNRFKGVQETRPYIDIGVALLKDIDGNLQLVDYIDTQYQREIFLELNLDKGYYIIVPNASGLDMFQKNKKRKKIKEFNEDNSIVISVINNIFDHYNLLLEDYIDYESLKQLYDVLNLPLSERKFKLMLKKCQLTEIGKLDRENFIQIFLEILKKKKKIKLIYDIFKQLGYDDTLFSNRSRLFTLSCYSDTIVKLTVQNSFSNCIDYIVKQLQIQKSGQNIENLSNTENNKSEVQAYYYFNSQFKKTDRQVDATLDLTGSSNMISEYKGMILTKKIPPQTLEFMMHAEANKNAEEYFRSSVLTWVQFKFNQQ